MNASTYALDCSLVSDVDTCNTIVNSDLTDTEKEELYQALLFVEFPDYDYVYNYNTNVEWVNTPENVTEYDSKYTKNAWILLASVMPSVSINDTLYYNGDASVLIGYDYDIEIPSSTISGDCRTIYDVSSVSRSHRVYVNGNIVGYSELVSFTSDEDVDVETEITITVVVSIKHYKIKTTKPLRGTCQYYSTEIDTDTLTISDSKELFYLDDEPSYSINIEDQGYDSYNGELSITNYTAYDFIIGSGSYQKRDWYYSYDIIDNIIIVVAEPYEREVVDNINFLNGSFTIQEINPCSLTLYSHFDSFIYDCYEDFEDVDIGLETDKSYYNVGDTIEVTITPSDKEVLLTYGDIEENVTGFTSLTATQSGLVKIVYGGKTDTEQVYVRSESWNIFWLLVLFGILIYLFGNFSLVIWRKIRI